MISFLTSSLLALALALPVSFAGSNAAPCVCCGDGCTCTTCVCDAEKCACDVGGECACDTDCKAECCGSCEK